jgi:hypothetical protein
MIAPATAARSAPTESPARAAARRALVIDAAHGMMIAVRA